MKERQKEKRTQSNHRKVPFVKMTSLVYYKNPFLTRGKISGC